MSKLAAYIDRINKKKQKVLSVFLTAGFPDIERFVDLALNSYAAGADILELGIPFSDPIADGPVIQRSSQTALENGVTLKIVLEMAGKIKVSTSKPLILMGYANPILHYGLDKFLKAASDSGVNGIIVPDIPLEEYDNFWGNKKTEIDRILLTTPVSTQERIGAINLKSEGFVYCVSMTGTTGMYHRFNEETLKNLEKTYTLMANSKMLVGFGISGPEDIRNFHPYCDGVIVGSAIINSLKNDETIDFKSTLQLINTLKKGCE
jgi:tryptophan synthase alpha chain